MVLEGLVLYLPLDEGSGSIAYDGSGNGNNGNIYGAEWVDGKLGKAIRLRGYGTTDYVETQNTVNLVGKSSAWCFWVKPLSFEPEWGNKGLFGSLGWSRNTITFILSSSNRVQLHIGTINNEHVILTDNTPLQLNEWVFYAGIIDNANLKAQLYRNGVKVDEKNLPSPVNFNFPVRFGRNWNTYYNGQWYTITFNGAGDELRVYNRVLSEAEIKWLYENSRARLGAAPLMITDFNESSEPVGAEWHAWEEGQVAIKRYVYGIKRTWRLTCIEKDIAWSDSAARYLQQKMAAGETVTFTVNEGERYSLPATTCHITGLELEIEPTGQQNIRKFTVTLKER